MSRENCCSVVFMFSSAVNSTDFAPKFSIVIMSVIVDLEISLYLQSKLRFIVRRDDGSAISYRNHVRFNHNETMLRVQYSISLIMRLRRTPAQLPLFGLGFN